MPLAPPWVKIGPLPKDELVPVDLPRGTFSEEIETPSLPNENLSISEEILRSLAFFSQHESLQLYGRLKVLSLMQPSEATGQILIQTIEDGQHLQILRRAVAKIRDSATGSQVFEITARSLVETTQPLSLLFAIEVIAENLHFDILTHVLKTTQVNWMRELLSPIAKQEERHVEVGLQRARAYLGIGLLSEAALLNFLEPRGSFFLTAAGVEDETKTSLGSIISGKKTDGSDAASTLKPMYQKIQENHLKKMIEAGIKEGDAVNLMNSLRLTGPGLC